MYLRRVQRQYKDKSYSHYLLVECVQTPKGPRQRIVCSLGDLKPKPLQEWLRILEHAVDSLKAANVPVKRNSATTL
jgi:hypothetical protein